MAPVSLADEKERIQKYLAEIVPMVRDRRRPKENDWLKYDKCWNAKFDRTHFGDSVSNHYIPAGRRAIEKIVSRGVSMLAPSPQFFECYPMDEENPQAGAEAQNAQAYIGHITTNKMRLRSFLGQIIRSFTVFERAIVKCTIKAEDVPVLVGGQIRSIRQIWPTPRVVDPFLFYMWPETVSDPEECTLLIEDAMLSYDEYEKLSNTKICDPIERGTLMKPNWPLASQVRLANSGIAEPSATPMPQDDARTGQEIPRPAPSAFVQLSYCWYRRGGAWRVAWLVWNVPSGPRIVRYEPAPLPVSDYLVSTPRAMPGVQYTSGVMADLEPVNIMLNDLVNMTFEAQFTEMSPPVMLNPLAIFDKDSLRFRPRAKWLVDPSGIQVPNWPQTSKVGYQGIAFAAGLIDQYSGTSGPLPDGQPARGMPRAGFAVSNLIQLSMSDIRGIAELLEEDILTPMLNRLYWLGVLFTPPDQRLQLPAVMSLPARQITPGELAGNWTFKWTGSLQAQDFQVRAQRLVAFMGMLAKLMPFVERAGKTPNWEMMFKRVWREAMGERGAESFLTDISPEQLMLQMLMAGGGQLMGGGTGPPQGSGAKAPGSAEQADRSNARQMSEGAAGAAI